MGVVDWFRNLCKKKEVVYACPKCGCKELAYFNVISNFVQVVREGQSPTYEYSTKCTKCGYMEHSIDNSHLKYFESDK